MTPKQEKFCIEYLIDLNATQAAKRAGYSEKTAGSIGQRLLKKVEIQKRITTLRKTEFKKTIMTAEEVESLLSKAARGEMAEEVVVSEGIGKGKTEIKIIKKEISAKDRLKALELMGKRHHLFENINMTAEEERVTIIDDTD
ncbi:terminase small subunit [Dialister micraerophilus]|uniref:terminase small subunit n=1 Tax=Dialister micraerophilus TaxID=309120 RepID=UPI0023F1FE30|nr:terminase small subunit [Dialister micraerophilus]